MLKYLKNLDFITQANKGQFVLNFRYTAIRYQQGLENG